MTNWEYSKGMALIDIFALEAMKVFLRGNSDKSWESLAIYSYSLANEMIKERERILDKDNNK